MINLVCLSPNGQCRIDLAAPPSGVVVGTMDGVAVVERDPLAASWNVSHSQLRGKHVSSLLIEADSGSIFAGFHDGGIFFSRDRGVKWERRANGLRHQHVFSLASTERNGRRLIYAGTEPVSLYRSENLGLSWEEFPAINKVSGTDKWSFPAPPHLAHTKSLAIDPRNPDAIYAAIEQGALLFTKDGGANWQELDAYYDESEPVYRDIHRVVIAERNPEEMYMTSGMGLYHSFDGGCSWEKLTGRDFAIGYPDHFTISPFDDSVLYLAGARTNPGAWRQSHTAEATILRSDDKGRTWRTANHGLDVNGANIEAMSLAVYPGGFSIIIGTTDGKVYCSDNGGDSWSLIATGLAPISKGGHALNLRMPAS